MSLKNYFLEKTIKISDSFIVEKYVNKSKQFIELMNCVGFTLPEFAYKEETQKYGNISQTFLIPNYETANQLKLEFIEFETGDKKRRLENISNSIRSFLTPAQCLDNTGYITNFYSLNEANFYDQIRIRILNNKLDTCVYYYNFKNLKLIDYSLPSLDYSSDSIMKTSITLSFDEYTKGIPDEDIKYIKFKQNSEE